MGVLMPTVFSVKQILEYFVYFVFQIQSRTSILYFRPQVEVFDKSISNTFLKSILYFVFKYFKKSIFYNSGHQQTASKH